MGATASIGAAVAVWVVSRGRVARAAVAISCEVAATTTIVAYDIRMCALDHGSGWSWAGARCCDLGVVECSDNSGGVAQRLGMLFVKA